jgi:hypothetical protein
MSNTYSTDYDPTLVGSGSVDTTSRPSAAIWHDCPILQITEDPGTGYLIFDDFLEVPKHLTNVANGAAQAGRYSTFLSSTSTISGAAETGGAAFLTSTGDDLAAVLASGGTPFNLASGQKKLWFEARVKVGSVSNTKNNVFIGLFSDTAPTATVPMTALGAMAADKFVGFHRLEGDGDRFDLVHGDGTAATLLADAVTLAANTYVKVGMVFNGSQIEFFADGLSVGTLAASATNYPDSETLGPMIAILGASGSDTTGVYIDWWRVAQER